MTENDDLNMFSMITQDSKDFTMIVLSWFIRHCDEKAVAIPMEELGKIFDERKNKPVLEYFHDREKHVLFLRAKD